EGTGSKPGVPDVPSDDSKEELSWKSSDDEDVGGHEEGNKSVESDDDRDEGSDDDSEETVKTGAEKVKVKVITKKLEKRKRKVLIRFQEHMKKVRRKAMMRRSRI
nr:hypothetical protein [Tanacetum cinerariifolium]